MNEFELQITEKELELRNIPSKFSTDLEGGQKRMNEIKAEITELKQKLDRSQAPIVTQEKKYSR
jgi:hypothetical protein